MSATLSLAAAVLLLILQHNPSHAQQHLHTLPGRTTIVQLFEWRFDDIAYECEHHLAAKGFAAVQVSPVTEHLITGTGAWWERYQPISYRIESRSGDEQQFADMVRRCNRVGVRVYVDVILNHMAKESPPPVRGSAGSTAEPTSFSYPAVPFTREHFNEPCEIDNWNHGPDLRDCQLDGLPDLNLTLPYVRGKQVAFLNRLLAHGVAGFRLEAAKHMWPRDLKALHAELDTLSAEHGFSAGRRALFLLEMIDFGSVPGELGRWQFARLGRISDFLVPGELGRAFRGYNDLKYLHNWGPQWTFLPGELGVVFLTDHELQRGRGVAGQDSIDSNDEYLYKQTTAFMLAHPLGTPRIYSSYKYEEVDDGPPLDGEGQVQRTGEDCAGGRYVCEHRWPIVANMVQWRVQATGSAMSNWWDNNEKQIAFSRQDRTFIAINGHKKRDFTWRLQTCLPAGRYCDVATGEAIAGRCTGGEITVDADGHANVFIPRTSDSGVLAIHVGEASALSRTCAPRELNAMLNKYMHTTCFRGIRLHLWHDKPKRT